MAEKKTFTIAEDDWNRMIELSKTARSTPVIYMPVAGTPIEKTKSWADHAYDNVNDWWKHMGEKHGFKWDTAGPGDEAKRQITAESR